MRDALSILASATVLPPSATTPHRHRRLSTSTTTNPRPKSNPKLKPQISTSSPLLSSSRVDNRQSLMYYTELASKLAEDGRFEDFLMISETVVASGVKPSEYLAFLNANNVSSGIAAGMLVERKLSSVVEMLFNGVRKLGIEPVQLFDGVAMESLSGECRRLLKCGEVEQLVSVMEILAGFQFRIKELVEPSDVINLCINKRDPTAAIRFAQNFPHAETLFCSIILEFGKKRDLESALTAFEASKKNINSPNMHAFRTIIDVCGLCGDYLKSRDIYEGLLAGNITPNTYVFNSLMNVNSHDLNYTLDIYKKMEKLGVTADITSHNILLKSCCLAAKVELARDVYRQIRKLESKGELKLDVFTYSTMIKVFADAKKWKLALEIKEDMVSSGVIPNTVTWSSLISACANAGLSEQAYNLFDEMLQAGVQPNAQCFNILLHACVESCQFDRAFRLFQCWKERGLRRTVTDYHLNNSNQRRVPLRPYSHITERVPFRPTTSTYNILMKACGTDYYRAKALMDEMKTLGLSPNHISWSILIDICGGSGNVMGAIQILRSMRESGIQPDVITYTTAIKICVEHKNIKLAFTLFAEMQKYQIKPNLVTYNTILRARDRYGSLQQVQQCLAVYQHMRKAGYKPNDNYLKRLVEEWCEGVIQSEHQNKSQFASRLTEFGPQSLLLEKVAEHLQDKKFIAELKAVDNQKLDKNEAVVRLPVVLQRLKEDTRYGSWSQAQDEVLIAGFGRKGHAVGDIPGVRFKVVKVLCNSSSLSHFILPMEIRKCKRKTERAFSSFRTHKANSVKSTIEIFFRQKRPRKSIFSWLSMISAPLRMESLRNRLTTV
ncbi:hypothetical protein DH2020_017879 [Rehmannia glutinosa]|uniref:Pentatricopeptide repeat-containing protein n=1 Tax=Rehmannia glutinosa TaxID=99300 RepID=A0ABR0WKW0_REHGL